MTFLCAFLRVCRHESTYLYPMHVYACAYASAYILCALVCAFIYAIMRGCIFQSLRQVSRPLKRINLSLHNVVGSIPGFYEQTSHASAGINSTVVAIWTMSRIPMTSETGSYLLPFPFLIRKSIVIQSVAGRCFSSGVIVLLWHYIAPL